MTFEFADIRRRHGGRRSVFQPRGRRTAQQPRGRSGADKSPIADIDAGEERLRRSGPDPRRSARPQASARHGHLRL